MWKAAAWMPRTTTTHFSPLSKTGSDCRGWARPRTRLPLPICYLPAPARDRRQRIARPDVDLARSSVAPTFLIIFVADVMVVDVVHEPARATTRATTIAVATGRPTRAFPTHALSSTGDD